MIQNITSHKELLEIAKSSTDTTVLAHLKDNCNDEIRRAVARNLYATTQTLESLLMDSVLNVSYMVAQNPNCVKTREFRDISNPCVRCLEDERYRNCQNCDVIKEYQQNIGA
jgi:hypothetical protein